MDVIREGAGQAFKGLEELFGDPSLLGAGPLKFDEETYAKALPHFKAALEAVLEAGQTLKHYIQALAEQFGTKIRPYLARFAEDVRKGLVAVKGMSPARPVEVLKAGAGEGAAQELDERAVFETYRPAKLRIAGAKDHPGVLVESSAMASVAPPDPVYRPTLPPDVVGKGLLSLAQLESAVYAGQAHGQFLDGGQRRGFFIGDGTGVGKGRQIGGIVLDNFMQGRRRALWVSEKSKLLKDAQRDWAELGQDAQDVFPIGKTKPRNALPPREGILFSTYATLAASAKLPGGKTEKARLKQIAKWLGKDFEGVIIFDEAHNMQKALDQKGKRGKTPVSQAALAGAELQELCPKARVVYVSATGATEVGNLAYASRLGLWGKGTPFASARDFVNQISSAGLSAMELVASDLKRQGLYLSRSLDYRDTQYRRLEHKLTASQREVYDEMARAWQIVLGNIGDAVGATRANGQAKSAAMSRFWSCQQRFFNQILSSMQMPTVLADIERALAEGSAAVLQLVSTNEVQQERASARMGEDDDLEELDLSPREILLDYLKSGFPTQNFIDATDRNGNQTTAAEVDSRGDPVHNADAVAMREALLARLGALPAPDSPIDMILDKFGADAVAEVTGRSSRLVRKRQGDGSWKRVMEPRSPARALADVEAFQAGKKKILVFSDAGGTGMSYHADRRVANRRQRVHYVVQAGWRADKAVQGLGRTHRTNQVSAPVYVLPCTDLKGHKRFMSSVARRLDQMGALTRGQRQASGGNIFDESDNLENRYAKRAVDAFFEDLFHGQVEGMTFQDLAGRLGLANLVDKDGALNRSRFPEVPQFLNRILTLEFETQNQVFDAFHQRMSLFIQSAAERGELDMGMETIKAEGARIAQDKEVAAHESGAATRYVRVEGEVDISKNLQSWAQVGGEGKIAFLARAVRGEHRGPWLAYARTNITRTGEDGTIQPQYKTFGAATMGYKDAREVDRALRESPALWEVLKDPGKMKKAWEAMIEEHPRKAQRVWHFITGAILPIWDRVSGQSRVARIQTQDGERILGRLISEKDLKDTLKRLGVEASGRQVAPERIVSHLAQGDRVELANGWTVKARRVSGESRFEVAGPDYKVMDELRSMGVFSELIQSKTRFFVPTGADAAKVLGELTRRRPVVNIVPAGQDGSEGSMSAVYGNPLAAPEIWDSALDAADRALQPAVRRLGAAWNALAARLPKSVQAMLHERFSDIEDVRRAFERKQNDELADSRLRSHFLRAIHREDFDPEELAVLDRILRGTPEELIGAGDRLRGVGDRIAGQWRPWAQEMTAALETLGLPFREEWKEGPGAFYPNYFRKHAVKSIVMGRLFGKTPEGGAGVGVKPGKEALGHAKARLTDRFSVWSNATGKIVTYKTGKGPRQAIFKTREAAEDFAGQAGLAVSYAGRAAAQLHRVFPGNQRASAMRFISEALKAYPQIVSGPIEGDLRENLRGLAERLFPEMNAPKIAEALNLIPGSRQTGRYHILEPMTHEQMVANGLIESPLFNIDRAMGSVSSLVRRTQFLDKLGGMVLEDGTRVAAAQPDGLDRVRLQDAGFSIPPELAKNNANIRALRDGWVLTPVAKDLAALYGKKGLAGTLIERSERMMRWMATVGSPGRYLKQPVENELALFLWDSGDWMDAKARLEFMKDLVRFHQGHSVPIVEEALDMGLHADAQSSEALMRSVFEGIALDGVQPTLTETILANKLKDGAEAVKNFAEKIYGWEDIAYKIYAYARERGHYGSGRGASREEAYERVNGAFFNYAEAPRIVHAMSRYIPFRARVLHQFGRIMIHHLKNKPARTLLKVALMGLMWDWLRDWLHEKAGIDEKAQRALGRFAPGPFDVILPATAGPSRRNLRWSLSWLVPFYNEARGIEPQEGTEAVGALLGWTPMIFQYGARVVSGKRFPGRDAIREDQMTTAQQAAQYLSLMAEGLPNIYGQYWVQLWRNAHKEPQYRKPYWEWATKAAAGLGTIDVQGSKELEETLRGRMERARERGDEEEDADGPPRLRLPRLPSLRQPFR